MDYDYRNRMGSMHRPQAAAASLYPRIGQQPGQHGPPPAVRASYHQPGPASSSSGLGIRVTLKSEYRITPPPQLAPQVTEVPRSTFSFDFDFEKRILAEADKESQNWSRIVMENQSSKTAASTPSALFDVPSELLVEGLAGDPVVDKFVTLGLPREAVSLAVLNYGDNPIKVREFVKSYNLLREMGFASKNVAEALAMYDNDTDKALAHFLNSSS